MSNAQEQHTYPEWTVGDRLRKAREFRGLGVQEMADRLGVGRNTITNAERMHVVPDRRTIAAYSLATGVPVEWITGDTGEQGERLSRCTGASRLAA